MKLIQEIKRTLPNVDLSKLSREELRTWNEDKKLMTSANKSRYEGRILDKIVDQVAIDSKIGSYPKEVSKIRDRHQKFARISFDKRYKETSFALAKSLERESSRLHVYDVALDCVNYLITYYFTHDDETKANRAAVRSKNYLRCLKYQSKARRCYLELHNKKSKKVVLSNKLENKISVWADEFESQLNSIQSLHFQLNARLIISQHKSKSTSLIEFLRQSLEHFNTADIYYRPGVITFTFLLAQELIANDEYREAEHILIGALENIKKKDHIYDRVIETKLRLHIRQRDASSSELIIGQLNSRRGSLSKTMLARLKIYKLNYAIIIDDLSNVRIKKIINELSEFSKDKSGFNLCLIISELVYNILKGNIDFTIDKKEAIEQYLRYHKLNFTREAAFINLLLTVSYTPSDMDRFEEMSRMHRNTMNVAQNIENDLEVINFNEVWDIISQRYKPRRKFMRAAI